MKAIYLSSVFTILLALSGSAATHIIEVENDEFSPAGLTVNVGDSILWIWDEGVHTTTSDMIPSGAASWNQYMDANNLLFYYQVTVPGTYYYRCNYHYSMGMIGSFVATGTASVGQINQAGWISLYSNFIKTNMRVDFDLMKPDMVDVKLFNLTGREVLSYPPLLLQSGKSSMNYAVQGLPAGLYIVTLATSEAMITRRIVVQP